MKLERIVGVFYVRCSRLNDGTSSMMMKPYQLGLVAHLLLCCIIIVCTTAAYDEIVDDEAEPHPDPNNENYSGMIYIGRMDDDGKRVGWHTDNGRMEHLC